MNSAKALTKALTKQMFFNFPLTVLCDGWNSNEFSLKDFEMIAIVSNLD